MKISANWSKVLMLFCIFIGLLTVCSAKSQKSDDSSVNSASKRVSRNATYHEEALENRTIEDEIEASIYKQLGLNYNEDEGILMSNSVISS